MLSPLITLFLVFFLNVLHNKKKSFVGSGTKCKCSSTILGCHLYI